MSKQLKKQTLAIGAVGVGLGALVGHADADTIVYSNGNDGGERHGDTNVTGNATTRTQRPMLIMSHNCRVNTRF